ncbi:hypothetical protein RL2103A [Rhizobium johnstonii 3841]|uniref:Uncharacterized protein n=1 Tax=Rhizobium johnstonii (strain DSM 114642 / LMG 32736 / 3841) TaxID=216596 RepID=Q1MHG7_RHIJ3|nr:hypothetical protein RL2103A [Rhizobium johnstonii 3841]
MNGRGDTRFTSPSQPINPALAEDSSPDLWMQDRKILIGRQPACRAHEFGVPGAIVRQHKATLAVGDQADILGVADDNVEERRDASTYDNGIELRRTFDHELQIH